MNGKTYRKVLLLCFVCGTTLSHAQEWSAAGRSVFSTIPESSTTIPATLHALTAPESISSRWLYEQFSPVRREQRMIRETMARRVSEQMSIIVAPNYRRQQEIRKSVGQWQFKISNTPNNWSPFQDARLDARTLRYPLPRKNINKATK